MNKYELVFLALLLGLLPCSNSLAQNSLVEICDNAIDVDADGLIDLNDSDCNGPVLRPISLLPNSSFEELDCCPIGHSTVACAGPWTQASPNNDGHNDYFTITRDADLTTINQLHIYDRWGNPIYSQSEADTNNPNGWNGTSDGTSVNQGVYTYVIQATMIDQSQIPLSGMITLIR